MEVTKNTTDAADGAKVTRKNTKPRSKGSKQDIVETTPKDVETCDICCSEYTPLKRKKITCCHCQGVACVVCVKKYLLGTFDDAHCLFCRYPWSREFLDEALSQHFRMKEYKNHRENIICEREKARIPETQALVSTVDERMRILDQQMKELDKNIRDLEIMRHSIYKEYTERIRLCKQAHDEKSFHRHYLHRVLRGDSDEVPGDDHFLTDTLEKIKKILIPCPNTNCHAYLDNRFTCDVCKVVVCRSCHVIKKDGHECNEDDIATVKQLKRDSKNCPGCGAFIYKIDGCDQMWCTLCHTAFSWKTGIKIEHGQIHNPHFYEWRRTNGGLAPGAVDAEGCPIGLVDINVVENRIRQLTSSAMSPVMTKVHREVVEITDYHLNHQGQMTDPTRWLRIQYFKGHRSEESWKQELQRHEKKEMKKFEVNQVYQMYVATMRDIFRAIATANSVGELFNIQEQMVSLQDYVFQNLTKINSRYGSTAQIQYAIHGKDIATTHAFAVREHMIHAD